MAKHKLLLADDSITIQKVVNLTFADEGIEVISVGDGNSAMEKFEEFSPDLVMADINMPGLSGYEICERIKGDEATRRIPVILLVGSFEPFDEREAQRVGANDYLTKPFQSIRQLVSKVSDLLNQQGEDAPPVPGSFDETLRMNDETLSQSETGDDLNDVGTDDEMIQSYQVGGFQFDETSKFESPAETADSGRADTFEPDTNDAPDTSFETVEAADADERSETAETAETSDTTEAAPYDFSPARQEETETEFPAAETDAIENDASENETLEFDSREFSTELSAENVSSPTPMPERSPMLDLDDMDLLELPPRRSFSGSAPVAQKAEEKNTSFETAAAATGESAENNETPVETASPALFETSALAQTSASESSASSSDSSSAFSNITPEMIEAIATRVVEKISDKVIRDIAWEVVPQMTDLIVKRMAEEKLKE